MPKGPLTFLILLILANALVTRSSVRVTPAANRTSEFRCDRPTAASVARTKRLSPTVTCKEAAWLRLVPTRRPSARFLSLLISTRQGRFFRFLTRRPGVCIPRPR